jgi:CHAD domain-containing protein
MIAEADVSADPAARRLASRLIRQGAEFQRLAGGARTKATVHRLRVLTRRMRASCSVARRLASADSVDELARRLRKLGRALGARRTLDVAAADYAALSGGNVHPAIESARAEAEARLARRMRPKHRDAILAAVQTAADALRAAEIEPGWLGSFLGKRSAGLRKTLGAESKKDLHGLRIEAKKFRYALETARAMGHRTSRGGEQMLKRLQRQLGRIHDLESLRALLPARDAVAIRAAAREAALRVGVRPIATGLRSVRTQAWTGSGRTT